jgi:hypothetical protein
MKSYSPFVFYLLWLVVGLFSICCGLVMKIRYFSRLKRWLLIAWPALNNETRLYWLQCTAVGVFFSSCGLMGLIISLGLVDNRSWEATVLVTSLVIASTVSVIIVLTIRLGILKR